MRCVACNKRLTQFEMARKSKETGEYLYLCNKDFEPIRDQVKVSEKYSLFSSEDLDDEPYYEEGEL